MTDKLTPIPTDAEILDAAEDFRSQYTHGGTTFDEFDEIGFTRAVLAKWGTPAPVGVGEVAEHYRNAIASACEGWTMPDGLRKHLETALWSPPTPQPTSPQADSVPAVSDLPPLPAPDLRDVGTKPQEIKEFLKGYATEYARTAIAARAPADSVQEDAALLDWLEQHDGRYYNLDKVAAIVGTGFLVRSEGNMPQVHSTLREAVYAARKQGASHDR